jgi:hypothetical protein
MSEATGTIGPQSSPVATSATNRHRHVEFFLVLVVVGLLIGPAVWLEFVGPRTHPDALAIGSNFAFGIPTGSVCPIGSSFGTEGCSGNHYAYVVPIDRALVPFGEVAVAVATASGRPYNSAGGLGFTVIDQNGVVLAQAPVAGGLMSMSSTGWAWTYQNGTVTTTPLSTSDYFVLDMGISNPNGLGLTFAALGEGIESGTTTPIVLP